MLKENQIAISGRVSGVWNNQEKKFEIKSGVTQNGKKFQIFEISVSKKEDENWINGKGMKIMLWGEAVVAEKSIIGLVGRLQPDNYTNKDGVEVRGNMILAFDNDMFTPEKWENSQSGPSTSGAPDPTPPENANQSGDNIPF